MADEQLPRPDDDTEPGWEIDLARALGYTVGERVGERMPDGTAPTAWNLRRHPFAFLEQTREVIAWEVEGEPDETGIRRSQVDPMRPNEILLRPVRYPLPPGFDFATIRNVDGSEHHVVLRST